MSVGQELQHMLLALLVYADAVGERSSRRIERLNLTRLHNTRPATG